MKKIKLKALYQHIPILSDEGILFIQTEIEKRGLKTMLEIGTAIGYSSIALSDSLEEITTLERDPKLHQMAVENIKEMQKDNIKAICADALDYEIKTTYDLIFIDAAKAQYERFFVKYAPYLNEGGVIICDNLNFHHLDQKVVSRGTRHLLRKLENFKTFLANHDTFTTTFSDIGDGMSLSWRKDETTINTL